MESSTDLKQQQSHQSLFLAGLSDLAPPPPPSPEKTRRETKHSRHRRDRPTGESAKLELEVEELLDNATRWRRTRQPRIRTPVRRAVLGYSTAAPSGRRHAVLRDLSARVRELEVDALSRGIACSLAMRGVSGASREEKVTNESEMEKASISAVGSARLDPRVRKMYQELMPRRAKTTIQAEEDQAAVAATPTTAPDAWPQHDNLPTRQSSHRRRLQSVRSRATEAAASAHPGPVRRVKTSFTLPASVSVAVPATASKLDLLQQRQINGEVQRSLYTERSHGLRRLLQSDEDSSGSSRGVLLGGVVGIGSSLRRY